MTRSLKIKELIEGGHKKGCTCNFCKNKGNIANLKRKQPTKETEPEEPEDPKEVQEGRDDIDKLGLSKTEKKYARMSTADAMAGKKPELYMDMVASVTNQKHRKKGFGNEDRGATTAGKKLESLSNLVRRIIG